MAKAGKRGDAEMGSRNMHQIQGMDEWEGSYLYL